MDQNFCDLRHPMQNSVFYIVRDVVPITHRQSSLDDDMQVNVVAKAHLADIAFLKSEGFTTTSGGRTLRSPLRKNMTRMVKRLGRSYSASAGPFNRTSLLCLCAQ